MKRFLSCLLAVSFFMLAGHQGCHTSRAVYAQDAKVIILSQDDSQKALVLWGEKLAADRAWDQFTKKTADKYTLDLGKVASGWESGVKFSEDFRCIVPANTYTFMKGSYFNGVISADHTTTLLR